MQRGASFVQDVVRECAFQVRAQLLEDKYKDYLISSHHSHRAHLPSFSAPWEATAHHPTAPWASEAPLHNTSLSSSLLDYSVRTEDLEARVETLKADLESEKALRVLRKPPLLEDPAPPDSPTTRRLLELFSRKSSSPPQNHEISSLIEIPSVPMMVEDSSSWESLLRSMGQTFAPYLTSSAAFPLRRAEFNDMYSRKILRLRTDVPVSLLYDYLCAAIEDYNRMVLDAPLVTLSTYQGHRAMFLTDTLLNAFPENPHGPRILTPDTSNAFQRRTLSAPMRLMEGPLLEAIMVFHLVEEALHDGTA